MSLDSSDTSLATRPPRVPTPTPTPTHATAYAAPSTYEDSVELLRGWLNKRMRVSITDGRCIVGIFVCTDKDANVILSSCHEYSSSDQSM